MPHTSRRKRTSIPAQKRLQVTDDDGWTHVTSGSNVRRAMRTAQQVPQSDDKDTQAQEPILGPAEAPTRLTFEELQTQYAAHRERWEDSETWETLTRHLSERMAERERIVSQEGPVRGPVDAIVCIGLGSPSGFLRGGWVDRRSVSMYQLAALDCIAKQLSRSFPLFLTSFTPGSDLHQGRTTPCPSHSLSTHKTPSSTPSTLYSSNPSG